MVRKLLMEAGVFKFPENPAWQTFESLSQNAIECFPLAVFGKVHTLISEKQIYHFLFYNIMYSFYELNVDPLCLLVGFQYSLERSFRDRSEKLLGGGGFPGRLFDFRWQTLGFPPPLSEYWQNLNVHLLGTVQNYFKWGWRLFNFHWQNLAAPPPSEDWQNMGAAQNLGTPHTPLHSFTYSYVHQICNNTPTLRSMALFVFCFFVFENL